MLSKNCDKLSGLFGTSLDCFFDEVGLVKTKTPFSKKNSEKIENKNNPSQIQTLRTNDIQVDVYLIKFFANRKN
jgi:hypothetical protein